jgi:hypothetical protein
LLAALALERVLYLLRNAIALTVDLEMESAI